MAVTATPVSSRSAIGWWNFGLLDRYTLSQTIVPFLFGVAAFTGVGTTIDSLFEIIRLVGDGLPLLVGLQLYLLGVPKIIVLTFPMSVLLATLLTYNRMSSDSEIVALRSCGISPLRLMLPALLLSLAVTGLTFAFNETIVPQASKRVERMMESVLGNHASIRNNNILYQELGDGIGVPSEKPSDDERDRKLNRLFFARRFDGETMTGITLLDFTGEDRRILVAQQGIWLGENVGWEFTNGTSYILNDDGSYQTVLPFQEMVVDLPRSPIDSSFVQDPESMNISQLRDYIRLQEQAGQRDKVRSLKMDLELKYAIPFACVAFGLLGAPLGMRLQRTSGALGFSMSILLIFLYYVLLSVAQGLGQSGLNPTVAAWMPNVMAWGAAAALLWRAAKA
ncbi:MAG: LptF/LptG family permease [Cyanobacteria bacterium P01_E01_bin.34]